MTSLPRTCFISHAYADIAARDALIRNLPKTVAPIVFPPIQAHPSQFVSTPLIDAILDCEGLIYLEGGASDRSFWVAFERDYAIRAGKQVFRFNSETSELVPDVAKPLDLPVFASYHRDDASRVRTTCAHLSEERYFNVWLDIEQLNAGDLWQEKLESGLAAQLTRGGYLVAFWSRNASRSSWVARELERAAAGIERFNDRVLFARLDPTPLPEFWVQYQEPAVQLYGDSARPERHRIDDLVVRLYWLIYRNTRSAGAGAA